MKRAVKRRQSAASLTMLPPALIEQIEAFQKAQARAEKAPNTMSRYRYTLRQFAAFLVHSDVSQAQGVKITHLRTYADKLMLQRGLQANTIRSHLKAVCLWLKWLILEAAADAEDDPDNPEYRFKLTSDRIARFEKNEIPASPKHKYPAVVWEDLRGFVESVTNERPPEVTRLDPIANLLWLRRRAIYLVLWSTAARRSEILSIRREQLGREIVITGKGNVERTIFVSPAALDACHAYLAARTDANPALFVTHGRRHQRPHAMGYQTLQRLVETDREMYGVANMTPHKFRHLVARTILQQTHGNMALVQKVLGHQSIVTTQQQYAEFDDKFVSLIMSDVHPAHKKKGKRQHGK